MFAGFKRALPQISIFHRASSPPSVTALELLRAATSGPYPPKSSKQPLQFDLEVVEGAPTSDQLETILGYVSAQRKTTAPLSTLISAHPGSAAAAPPENVSELARLAAGNPNALKWPIVVDWTGGKASVGDVEGVKGILETIRQQRDGEIEGEKIDQPKGWFS